MRREENCTLRQTLFNWKPSPGQAVCGLRIERLR